MTLDRASQLGYLTFALTLAADQMTKFAILEVADDRAWSVTVTGFFNLVLVFNKGVSFGLFGGAGLPYQHLILSGIAIVVGLVLLNWLRQDLGQRLSLAYALIAGGAIGNAIDRLRIGAVAWTRGHAPSKLGRVVGNRGVGERQLAAIDGELPRPAAADPGVRPLHLRQRARELRHHAKESA